MTRLETLRADIRARHLMDEHDLLGILAAENPVSTDIHRQATHRAAALVRRIRADKSPGLMEVFLAEYGLSTDEGVALMCLAEALLRVPDSETIDALIEDKIAPSAWGTHLGKSSSPLVNASTWALMLTGKVLREDGSNGIAATLQGAVKRLGEPVIRTAVQRAIREMGHQFVLGRSIEEALSRGRKREKQGYTFSYDMLGEAALTADDARKYFDAYSSAIDDLSAHCASRDVRDNPGISVKLSALHPRYEAQQRDRVLHELVATTRDLARQAKQAGMGFNIDAEEADRLDLSLDVIQAVLRDPDLAGWDGFGVVVQAYGKRAALVIDWLYALATELDRKIMVRLVKGAYWDTEIKHAQVGGLTNFPVFTHKAHTDISYILCAKRLLGAGNRIYAQFATHNAHTVAAVLEMATDKRNFEFQRLQGMGESLHAKVLATQGTRCRIYAPVGTHRDLLAYLVRRLLENGANSSFVNQVVDGAVPPEVVAADPFDFLAHPNSKPATAICAPRDLFAPERDNSRGLDLTSPTDLANLAKARDAFFRHQWAVGPLIAGDAQGGDVHAVLNPAAPQDRVGTVTLASAKDTETALASARDWRNCPASKRAEILRRAADLYQENFGALFACLSREAGKTPADALSELREAIDFLRYYAAQSANLTAAPCGIFACISPWNFPLAIFTGQIAAALAAGNGVIAKPAEPTPIIAALAVGLLHMAGVPRDILQFLPGAGGLVGAAITSDARVGGVCFTGSIATAQTINRAMPSGLVPWAPLIAETGGLNAMIVDSTALPEQAIRDIIASAFQSAGQRCSALRMLYLQEDIAEPFLAMLFGAMDELTVGDPWALSTDIGPIINQAAQHDIAAYVSAAKSTGRLLKQVRSPSQGTFVAPAVIGVNGLQDLTHEVFGPVLHVATFQADEIGSLIKTINTSGYGLTFAMHSRIDDRVDQVISGLRVGNIYINRDQIGAVVGSQPFGGEGLSGTGPKAGGPAYLPRFLADIPIKEIPPDRRASGFIDPEDVQNALDLARQNAPPPRLSTVSLPGPTGESNRLSVYGRGTVLCLGPTVEAAKKQAKLAKANGCPAVIAVPDGDTIGGLNGALHAAALTTLVGFSVVAIWTTDEDDLRSIRKALAMRQGPLIALATGQNLAALCRVERHVCIDTTASGGNASLLAAAAQ